MEYKDYYKIMDLARDASADDIKKAYRRLARKYHPDLSKEADAEARFKEIGEANEVLKDPEKVSVPDHRAMAAVAVDFMRMAKIATPASRSTWRTHITARSAR